MEALAASFGISIVLLVTLAIVLSLLFPLFWIWMLVDALLRDSTGYPSNDIAEKIAWVVAMALIQPAAIVYFFVVWRSGRPSPAGSTYTAVPAG